MEHCAAETIETLTLVLPGPAAGAAGIAPGVARADGAVGFRCSPHPAAAALAREAEAAGLGPVTATSLNRSGDAPAHTRRAAESLCRASSGSPAPPPWVPGWAEDAWGGPPSTVLDLSCEPPRVLLSMNAISESRAKSPKVMCTLAGAQDCQCPSSMTRLSWPPDATNQAPRAATPSATAKRERRVVELQELNRRPAHGRGDL